MNDKQIKKNIFKFTIICRISVLGLQGLSNWLIPDHNADAFVSPKDPNLENGFLDNIVEAAFGGLVRWDAQYFLHVSKYGYTHENTLAFFPLFPMIIRGMGLILHLALQSVISFHSCLILSAVLFNMLLFIKTTIFFYELSKKVLKNENLAYLSALLFAINPSSIFFSAPYSETLYSCLVFYGLLENEKRNHLISSAAIALGTFARSNGVVNIGFFIYNKLEETFIYFNKIRNAKTGEGHLPLSIVVILSINYAVIPLGLSCLFIFLPFFVFQYWCYSVYCVEDDSRPRIEPHLEVFLKSNFLHSPDLGPSEWCYDTLPMPYFYVQDKYWEVGAFRYFAFRQLPNFLLATPIVLVVICHSALYIVDNIKICLRLGIPPILEREKRKVNFSMWNREGINSHRVFVYSCHALALCVFCVTCIHVQVSTRLLCSSSPVVYWFVAHQISLDSNGQPKGKSKSLAKKRKQLSANSNKTSAIWNLAFKRHLGDIRPSTFTGQLLLVYFLSYFVIGTILFSNFYPWT